MAQKAEFIRIVKDVAAKVERIVGSGNVPSPSELQGFVQRTVKLFKEKTAGAPAYFTTPIINQFAIASWDYPNNCVSPNGTITVALFQGALQGILTTLSPPPAAAAAAAPPPAAAAAAAAAGSQTTGNNITGKRARESSAETKSDAVTAPPSYDFEELPVDYKKARNSEGYKLGSNYFELTLRAASWSLHDVQFERRGAGGAWSKVELTELSPRERKIIVFRGSKNVAGGADPLKDATYDGQFLMSAQALTATEEACEPLVVETEVKGPGGVEGPTYRALIRWRRFVGDRNPTALIQTAAILIARAVYNIKDGAGKQVFKRQGKGRYFDFNNPIRVGRGGPGLLLWRGYSISPQGLNGGLFLSVDVSHRVIHEQTINQLLHNLSRSAQGPQFREIAASQIAKSRVITTYNSESYLIDSIAWDKTPADTFQRRKKKEDGGGTYDISFIDYYREVYNKDIRDRNQPLLVVKRTQRNHRANEGDEKKEEFVYLVPELCSKTGLDDAIRANTQLTTQLTKTMQVKAAPRAQLVARFAQAVAQQLDDMNAPLQLARDLFTVPATQKEPPTVQFRRRTVRPDKNTADWGRNLKGAQVIDSWSLQNWLLVYFGGDSDVLQPLQRNINRVASGLGIGVGEPRVACVNSPDEHGFREAVSRNVQESDQLVFVILPGGGHKQAYKAIKTFLAMTASVPSQCITAELARNGKIVMSALTKVFHQMTSKQSLRTCQLSGVDAFGSRSVMAMGVDKSASTVALTYSLDQTLQRYGAVFGEKSDGARSKPDIPCLGSMVKQALSLAPSLPEVLIIYRVGVGASQQASLMSSELDQLRQVVSELYSAKGQPAPALAYTLYLTSSSVKLVAKPGRNPLPGSMVDTEIVKGGRSFFLVPHSCNIGTAAPTEFSVLNDDFSLDMMGALKDLTYVLTHGYSNWPGAIRVPSPAQYARTSARFVNESLEFSRDYTLLNTQIQRMNLHEKLFFL